MNDIFISYAREDKPWAKRLAEALEGRGWSVWWDAEIPTGATWDEVIERELTAAKAVVVLWSQTSVKKRWVKTEASLALDANKLFPVLIDAALPPIAFRPIHAASLADWRGEAEHEGFALLVGSIERMAGPLGERTHPSPGGTPQKAGPIGTERPADAPPPRHPQSRRGLPLILGGIGAVGAAAIAVVVLVGTHGDKADPAVPPTKPAIDLDFHRNVRDSALPGRYPLASQRLLTDADLSGLSADELRLMRNEIYARKGYVFNDAGLRDYFSAQSWYRPASSNDTVRLSSVEQTNVAKIRAFEQAVDTINR